MSNRDAFHNLDADTQAAMYDYARPSPEKTICTFPMDKWVEFKEKLMDHFTNDATNRMLTSRLLEELESFGKPVVEAGIPVNLPIVQTEVKYFLDTQNQTIHRQSPDGQIDDLTNPDNPVTTNNG